QITLEADYVVRVVVDLANRPEGIWASGLASGLGHMAVLLLILLLAAAKALLVALNYTHLRYERLSIYAIVLVPVHFVVGLLLALIPDMVFGR
ncbi:MAG: hypothetical protein ACE5JN_11450, partial [Candidatus Methylomirabilia bacterium]